MNQYRYQLVQYDIGETIDIGYCFDTYIVWFSIYGDSKSACITLANDFYLKDRCFSLANNL